MVKKVGHRLRELPPWPEAARIRNNTRPRAHIYYHTCTGCARGPGRVGLTLILVFQLGHPVQGDSSARGLGWVDLNFECFTVCAVLPGLMGIWQKWLDRWARWWNTQIKVNPTQVHGQMGNPVHDVETQFQLHGGQLQGRAMPLERRRALQRERGRERQVFVAPEAGAVSLKGIVFTLWGVSSVVMFCFVLFQKFNLPIGLNSSWVSAQRLLEHVKNALQNIMT